MKSIDLFCASPASTAICSSMDHRHMVRQGGGTRPTDHHTCHRLGDHHHRHKTKTPPIIPCSVSQIPICPKPYFDKYRKSTSSASSTHTPKKLNLDFLQRKSSADITTDLLSSPSPSSSSSSRYLLGDTPLLLDLLSSDEHYSSSKMVAVPPTTKPLKNINSSNNNNKKYHDFKHELPVFRSSYSYENPVLESSSSCSPSLMLISSSNNVDLHAQKSSSLSRLNHHHHHVQKSRAHHDEFHFKKSSLSRTSNISHANKSSLATCKEYESSPLSKSGKPHDQVVELRVSIHCKGCEGKIRKHISRMEGVSSFSIDLATKKVTVIGNVTPLGVLTSISKVKNAEFWPSPTSSSTSSSSSSSTTTTTTTTNTSPELSIVSI